MFRATSSTHRPHFCSDSATYDYWFHTLLYNITMTKSEIINTTETNVSKEKLISQTESWLEDNNLLIESKDTTRPWGAFWHISPESTDHFLKLFFPDFNPQGQFISPKILLVEPDKRLSLQFHHQRAEEWHVVQGPVEVIAGDQDLILNSKQDVTLKAEEPHRLCGLKTAGVVAEIWKHTNPANPSTEDDIVRLQDDFHR